MKLTEEVYEKTLHDFDNAYCMGAQAQLNADIKHIRDKREEIVIIMWDFKNTAKVNHSAFKWVDQIINLLLGESE